MLKYHPTVFAVGRTYQIFGVVEKESLFWIRIGDNKYYDESNGIMRSLSSLHSVTVPMDELDSAKEYTVCIRPIIERKPYYPETEPVEEYKYRFFPVSSGNTKAYHLADAHNRIETPVEAAQKYGDFDFLILNGDIIDHSGDPSKFDNIYEICSHITKGTKPVVFSRGNHDLRGNYAERFADYTPHSAEGNTYYSFRLGNVWGVVLDCGEDKKDAHPEYGNTVCCRQLRMRQVKYLKQLIENKEKEYADKTVDTRVVIVHTPFTRWWDVDEDIYREWARLLREDIKPHVMICGHMHVIETWDVGCEWDNYGQPCPIVLGSLPESERFWGCGYEFSKNEINATFTSSLGEVSDNKVKIIKED